MTNIEQQNQDSHDGPVSEHTPLLSNTEASPTGKQQPNGITSPTDTLDGSPPATDEHEVDQIPKVQIFFLCCARLFEPIAFFSIFPFVNQMIFDTGEVKETAVGFYSGLIESIFSITQMLVMIPWGKLADHPRVGRKPVLVFSLVGVSICTALFGTSSTIWQMFLYRCSAGVFAGTVVTIRTMMAENSNKVTQARVFSWFAFSGNLGIFLGPLLGGMLANPVRQYPSLFGHTQYFKDYPYALATFVCGALGLLTALLTTIFVKETLKDKEKLSSEENSAAPVDSGMGILDLIRSPGVAMVLFLQCHIMLLAFSYTAVMPVFYFTPVRRAGFGFNPQQISLFMCLGGAAQSMWLLVAFPWIQRRYSTGTVIRACARAYPFFFLVHPLLNLVLRRDYTLAFWISGPILLMLGCSVAMSFTAIQLAINDVNPKPSTLGTLNSLALALVSGIRSFSPALFTSIFAVGVEHQIVYGYLIWIVLAVLALGFTFDCQLLPKNAEGKQSKQLQEADGQA
ncbi:uncharacterized protein HMPREF1541_05763 [Cyphellophora europaea CBS 101466]|uniref:Major facilitator superfamily (MFS) profile domain-containing protein n=1 Tax=Cyphellophora europaea (strain CBS 101466) TaxID=1220924 RepID=W2RSV7_CYPE1|nr:uncharacterized protein HMPREF1541_05763 [Cyphellophora europaea CBS 101466]ETN39537.1 hypothetical protein HMPREF1541_05763 [Cyphellophora europaea CBS 101466]